MGGTGWDENHASRFQGKTRAGKSISRVSEQPPCLKNCGPLGGRPVATRGNGRSPFGSKPQLTKLVYHPADLAGLSALKSNLTAFPDHAPGWTGGASLLLTRNAASTGRINIRRSRRGVLGSLPTKTG